MLDVNSPLAVPLMLAGLAAPIVFVVFLFRVSRRRLSGRRGRFDRFLGGVARGQVQASHLAADTPDVDRIAVPRAPHPGDRGR
jgi:hypothetical protein